ncbi:MAG: hypothetical protein HRT45_01180 [Bdellovibrionales bacterium]|nr:hypothetical protein [Bdellovibrionales bacterium]
MFQQSSGGGKLDLLFIVDNSDSMLYDHSKQEIFWKLQGIMNTLQGVDYHVAVMTSSVNRTSAPWELPQAGWEGSLDYIEGTNARYLTTGTPNVDMLVRLTLDREEVIPCRRGEIPEDLVACGSNNEQPLKALTQFVQNRNRADNAGFLRDDAELAVVIITDQDETGDREDETTEPEEAAAVLQAELGGNKKVSVHGIVIEPGDRDCKSEQKWQGWLFPEGADYATRIARMAEITEGSTTSICNNNEAMIEDLSVIGETTRGGALKTEFTLEHQPWPASVNVQMVPSQNINFSVDGNKIVFDSAPADGSEITITYQYQE